MVEDQDMNGGQEPDRGSGVGPATGMAEADSRGGTDVFGYEDYRAFMRDRFAELQARKRPFSQRGLARKARIANPGFFNEVIRGRRRLSPAAAAKMAVGLELSPMETDYFSALVVYSEAREPIARLRAGKRMLALKNRRLYYTLHGMQSTTDTLRRIMQELERDWVLQAADLRVDRAAQEGSDPVLDPMNESTLPGILEKLVCLRADAAPQSVHLSLLVAPRSAGP